MENLTTVDMQKRLIGEKKFQDLYSSVPFNPEVRASMNYAHSTPMQAALTAKWFAANYITGNLMTESLRRAHLPDYIEQIVKENPEVRVMIVHNSESQVSSVKAHNAMNERFDKNLQSAERARIHSETVEGATHAAFLNPVRLAQKIQSANEVLDGERVSK
jgi:hypothetical protein